MKQILEEYSEAEFLELIEKIYFVKTSSEDEHTELVRHFVKISEHPEKTDLLYYPNPGREDSPLGVIQEIKEWRAANGKPGFRKH